MSGYMPIDCRASRFNYEKLKNAEHPYYLRTHLRMGTSIMREAQPYRILARNNYELQIINYELFWQAIALSKKNLTYCSHYGFDRWQHRENVSFR